MAERKAETVPSQADSLKEREIVPTQSSLQRVAEIAAGVGAAAKEHWQILTLSLLLAFSPFLFPGEASAEGPRGRGSAQDTIHRGEPYVLEPYGLMGNPAWPGCQGLPAAAPGRWRPLEPDATQGPGGTDGR